MAKCACVTPEMTGSSLTGIAHHTVARLVKVVARAPLQSSTRNEHSPMRACGRVDTPSPPTGFIAKTGRRNYAFQTDNSSVPFFCAFFCDRHARSTTRSPPGQRPSRSYGIPFDVPIDSQQVVVRGHQARLESALPQSARAAMSVVEHLHVALRCPAKSRGRGTGERRSRQ